MNPKESGNGADAPPCTLSWEQGRLHLRRQGEQDAIPVSIAYLRPLSVREEVAFYDDDSHEVLSLESLDQLTPASRALAASQLAERYHLPRITQINSIETKFGTHYWRVETDKGPREFAFKEPGKNVTFLSNEHIVLRDTIGNRYEIQALSTLDSHSQRQAKKIL